MKTCSVLKLRSVEGSQFLGHDHASFVIIIIINFKRVC